MKKRCTFLNLNNKKNNYKLFIGPNTNINFLYNF